MEQNIENIYKNGYDKNSVLIIGSGPSGILASKYLSKNNNIICIENREDIGGQWNFDKYNEENHPNLQQTAFYHHYGVWSSSLYENLQANLPRFQMTFKGFPTKPEYQEFMKAEEFYEYLQDYCAHHQLKKYMLFNTFVSSVRLIKNLSEDEKQNKGQLLTKRFLIEIKDSSDYRKNVRYLQADNVIVATGHYSVPNYPKISNLELFQGEKFHTHYFRQNYLQKFTNKHLVIYGGSQSAQDLLCIILKQTDRSQHPYKITLIANIVIIDRFKQSEAYKEEIKNKQLALAVTNVKGFVSEKSLILESGEYVENIDILMFASGYQYCFPFLENSNDNLIEFVKENERKNCFGPLYKRLFCVREPNLIFLGMTFNTATIQQMFERQVICAQRFIDKIISLPSQEDMLKDFEYDFQKSQYNFKDGRDFFKVSHFTGQNEYEYSKQLCELAQMQFDEEFNAYVKNIFVPISEKTVLKGNYPWMKQEKISHLIPESYSPKEDLF
ncbi:flavin-binding monooxygenase-like protein (macronuclear) [Tetrahymena thermophila SB210]|uniref:Flavin-binding monooxygenase-like protein n=1 Tax=Tetrahymena thermophila (strain SB210) TaxID=312017 RepID=I7MG97_TETTS|nr:flavin-binding monooxygenase-like protein [Tetrahymena thermophila SB210]EAR84950.2 flavin-binding monooxygenase-like protein [Tetrahymena thermophila SB210]|eukprot:XP_001032613.2 flavin-binding monooxygenase-like protein [Tetrahymena thermophila SB210]